MCTSENTLKLVNGKNTEFDLFGDTRNNKKHNEIKFYSKHSYNFNELRRVHYIKKKNEINKEKELEKELKKDNVAIEKPVKNKKRELKKMNESDEEYGNNCEIITVKEKKAKKPKKDRVRF